MLVAVLVAVVFSAVALITIRYARSAHSSLSAVFRNIVRAIRSVLRDDGEMRFRALAEALPQIVWTASPGMGVDYCNCRWYELTGFTEAQTLGWGWPNALHPDDPSKIGRNAALPASRSRWNTACSTRREVFAGT
jgi:PAS domain-containing protein